MNSEQVAVIGAGRAGLATALTLSHLGHEVICTDIDMDRVRELQSGRSPFVEPELQERLDCELASGRLRFIVSPGDGLGSPEIAVVCVATPSDVDGSCDLSYLGACIDELEKTLEPGSLVVTKSTVPVGTNAQLAARLSSRRISVVSNPEFLREGAIMRDSLQPARIVLGGDVAGTLDRVAAMFSGLDAPIVRMSYEAAELTKYAANCYLAVRYSFVNELASLAGAFGADIQDVLRAMGLDSRIGSAALRPGPGWGGPCLPKDSRALLSQAEGAGQELRVLRAAVDVNESMVVRVVEQARQVCGGSLEGVNVALWGLAFKPDTDDARESPATAAARAFAAAGARCRAYDPAVPPASFPSAVGASSSAIDACADAELLVVLTAWEEFRTAALTEVARAMSGATILDTIGVVDGALASELGLRYVRVGQVVERVIAT